MQRRSIISSMILEYQRLNPCRNRSPLRCRWLRQNLWRPATGVERARHPHFSWILLSFRSDTLEVQVGATHGTNIRVTFLTLWPQLGRFVVGAAPGSTSEFRKFVADETEKWAEVVKFAGIKAD